MATPPVRLDHLSAQEAQERLGELVRISCRQKGACIVIVRRIGEITILDPAILNHIPDDEMALALLGSWPEEEIEKYLENREERHE